MTQYYGPRHTTLSPDPETLAAQASENARDTNEALGRKVSGYVKAVGAYSAVGATTATIPIVAATQPPQAVLLVRAAAHYSPSVAISVTASLDWYYVNGQIGVYEPSGLTANTSYDLTFLILE